MATGKFCGGFAPAHTYEAVTAIFTCAGQAFTAKGKTIPATGWKDIDRRFWASLKTDADEDRGKRGRGGAARRHRGAGFRGYGRFHH